MRVKRRGVLAATIVWAVTSPATAHTLHELEEEFVQSEHYFQPVDLEAPGFTLQDADGKPVSLADFRGKVVVLHFIYTNCPDFCPLHAEKIAEIQKMINITPMKTMVQFISVTTDPSRDNGPVLKDFGENHGLDPSNWIFLTVAKGAAEDSTRKLASSYGVEFKLDGTGEQMHGVVTIVIDQSGRIVGRFHSLKFESLSLVKFVNALINHAHQAGDSDDSFWQKLKDLL